MCRSMPAVAERFRFSDEPFQRVLRPRPAQLRGGAVLCHAPGQEYSEIEKGQNMPAEFPLTSSGHLAALRFFIIIFVQEFSIPALTLNAFIVHM